MKKKGDEQSLRLLREDPLVEIPMICRFGFPKPLCNNTYLKITQTAVPVGDFHHFSYSIDVVYKHNDRWLVVHPRYLLESWQGNLDYQLVVDYSKVFQYMTKYATKTELLMLKGIATMI